jgi:hypothetical protein
MITPVNAVQSVLYPDQQIISSIQSKAPPMTNLPEVSGISGLNAGTNKLPQQEVSLQGMPTTTTPVAQTTSTTALRFTSKKGKLMANLQDSQS